MVMKKFRGRRLRKTAMAVRAEGPRSWRQRAGCHETIPEAQLSVQGWREAQTWALRQGGVRESKECSHQVLETRTHGLLRRKYLWKMESIFIREGREGEMMHLTQWSGDGVIVKTSHAPRWAGQGRCLARTVKTDSGIGIWLQILTLHILVWPWASY